MSSDPPPARRSNNKPRSASRRNVVTLIAIAVLAGLLFWIATAIQKHNAMQNCIDSGRRDCVALPAD